MAHSAISRLTDRPRHSGKKVRPFAIPSNLEHTATTRGAIANPPAEDGDRCCFVQGSSIFFFSRSDDRYLRALLTSTLRQTGKGLIKVNGKPLSLIQPQTLRFKLYEPVRTYPHGRISRGSRRFFKLS